MNNIANTTPVGGDAAVEQNIGSLLLKMGKITPSDAERIMRLHQERGIRFGDAAKSLGLITEQDIQQVLSTQFDYPYVIADEATYSHELIAAYQPFSAQVEIMRAIRSQLMLNWFSKGKKALTVAAVNSGDGASYLVANLAVVFSQLGERTLLIDANLRAPRLHEIFSLKSKLGLSDVLVGRVGNEAIEKVNKFDELSVLGAGTLPPNPQELVSRSKFRQLIEAFHVHYDVILIDAPPFANGADTYAIAAQVGGALFVSRKNVTKLSDVELAAEQLKLNMTPVVGSVIVDF